MGSTTRRHRPGRAQVGGRPAPGRPALGRPARGRPARDVPLRAVLVMLCVAVAVAVWLPRAAAAPQPGEVRHAVVAPGDTLWDIAVRHAPAGEDPRRYLHDLRQLNDSAPRSLVVGDVIALPARRASAARP